jgi:hypothetical protein
MSKLLVDEISDADDSGPVTVTDGLSVSGDLVLDVADFGNWTITETSGVLYFATGGVNKMKLDSSGNITVVGNVTAYGTV